MTAEHHLEPEIEPSRSDGLPLPRRYLAIGALCAGTALVIIDGGIANVALPSIARDLGVDSSSVVAIVTVYQLMLVMLLLPFAGLESTWESIRARSSLSSPSIS